MNWTVSRDPATLAHSFAAKNLQYYAAVQRRVVISERSRERTLVIRGQVIDTVRELGSVPETLDKKDTKHPLAESAESMVKWLKESRRIANTYAGHRYGDAESLSEAYWRTLIGDRTQFARLAPSTFSETFNLFRAVMEVFKDTDGEAGASIMGYTVPLSAAGS